MSAYDRTYQVICETMVCEEGPYLAYGMLTRSGAIHDISPDRRLVEDLVHLFNQMQLDPRRAGDVIEHMLP